MEIYEILEGKLYQSPASEDWSEAYQRGIRAIIDMEGDIDRNIPPDVIYVHWSIVDGPLPDVFILDSLARFCCDLLHRGIPTLVHCGAGINRASLVVGSTLHYFGWHGQALTARIRERRPGALSNGTFAAFLEGLL